eukprot:c25894_g1_i1 orf=161-1684(+)
MLSSLMMHSNTASILFAIIEESAILSKKVLSPRLYCVSVRHRLCHISYCVLRPSVTQSEASLSNCIVESACEPCAGSKTCPTVKRKVAMWVGYVGTSYKGLQIQRSLATGKTIEEELEKAIFKSGGILETNFGSLEKIGWMRSSRTDKGVHSLSTVVTMKLEITQKTWENDPDGIMLADSINLHLPRSIRIFGIIPVNKSFNPRISCTSRTYNYLLPAGVLNITQETSSEEVECQCSYLKRILAMFMGRHPFHNYTVRSQYRKVSGKTKCPRRDNALEEIDVLSEFMNTMPGGNIPVLSSTTGAPEEHATFETVSSSKPRARWLKEPDMVDTIGTAHYRRIISFTCGGLENFNDTLFIRLSVQGESFMLHQIRKMVGTAVAVMRGILPVDIVPISLSRHTRVVLPLAPSEGLFLAKNEFQPFRTSSGPSKANKDTSEFPRLNMSEKVARKAEEFWLNVLLPEVAPLLDHSNPSWREWLGNLELSRIPDDEVNNAHAAWSHWRKCQNL